MEKQTRRDFFAAVAAAAAVTPFISGCASDLAVPELELPEEEGTLEEVDPEGEEIPEDEPHVMRLEAITVPLVAVPMAVIKAGRTCTTKDLLQMLLDGMGYKCNVLYVQKGSNTVIDGLEYMTFTNPTVSASLPVLGKMAKDLCKIDNLLPVNSPVFTA